MVVPTPTPTPTPTPRPLALYVVLASEGDEVDAQYIDDHALRFEWDATELAIGDIPVDTRFAAILQPNAFPKLTLIDVRRGFINIVSWQYSPAFITLGEEVYDAWVLRPDSPFGLFRDTTVKIGRNEPLPTPVPTATPTMTPSPTATFTPAPTSMPTATPTPRATLMAASTISLRGFTNGRWLEQQDAQLASAIKGLVWVRDGIDDIESEAIQDLLYIAVTSRSVVGTIVSFSWVQDGIDDEEAGAFRWLNNIGSADVASSVVTLSWMEDGIEEIEVKVLEQISYVDYGDSKVASLVVALDWVQDGIEEVEFDLIDAFSSIASRNAKEALRIWACHSLKPSSRPTLRPWNRWTGLRPSGPKHSSE